MRIRKHAKVSPLVYAASSLKPGTLLQTNVCQLNQSPWDVITFSSSDPYASPHPPHLYQVDGDDSFLGNSSYGDSIGAVESVASMKLSCDDDSRRWVYSDGVARAEGVDDRFIDIDMKTDLEDVLCCKTDEKGWQCKKRANKGQALCELHLSQLKIYNNNDNNIKSDQAIVRNSDKGSEPPRRRPRPRKASSASNPNDFYYYSGFGPRWGKRRGEGRQEHVKNCSISNDEIRNVDHLETIGEPSNEEFDYGEDDDVDEEAGKKRARKPIKARSLKSLM